MILAVHQRTLRRWMAERPEWRRVLCVRRRGRQWRVEWPAAAEWVGWVTAMRQAVAPFARRRRPGGEYAKAIARGLGYGDEQRERDLKILRQAVLLKRSARPLGQDTDSDETGSPAADKPEEDYRHWLNSIVPEVLGTTRMVSAETNCRVQDAPEHWGEFLRNRSQANRKRNEPWERWLAQYALIDRARQLLRDSPYAVLVAFISRPQRDGKPRVKLYRLPARRRAGKGDRWTPERFQQQEFQLLDVASEVEVSEQLISVRQMWPTRLQWQEAEKHYRQIWERHTLGEAAQELLRADESVTGENLARLLFRNPDVQAVWKIHQWHEQMKKCGKWTMCGPQCVYGKRGISLRTFRARYSREDVAKARDRAEGTLINPVGERINPQVEPAVSSAVIYGEPTTGADDQAGVTVLDGRGCPVNNATQGRTPRRGRRGLAQADFSGVAPEDRAKIEAVLGHSLEDYNPLTEI